MYGLPWIPIFLSWLRWVSIEKKIFAESPHQWQKLISTVSYTSFYFLCSILCSDRANKYVETIIVCSFRLFRHFIIYIYINFILPLNAVFRIYEVSYLSLWRHHPTVQSPASSERKIVTLWRHNHRLFLHASIDAKTIFTSEKQPWLPISWHPVFTA